MAKAEEKDISEWILTDDSCSQYQKYLGDGQYLMVELVWLDTCEGDEGHPDREYTVKSALIDFEFYTWDDLEAAISGYYDSMEILYNACRACTPGVIAECIFENMTDGSATTYGMMTLEEAKTFVQKYIEEH